jgi:hypothetical protein
MISSKGRIKNIRRDRIMGISNDRGYKYCGLISNDGTRKKLRIHRLMFFCLKPYTLVDGKEEVDHIDNDQSNNSLGNLRLASRKDQLGNTRLSTRNTSKHRGVTWDKSNKKWIAHIHKDNRFINLGRYTNKEEAVNAAKQARKEYFKEYFNV